MFCKVICFVMVAVPLVWGGTLQAADAPSSALALIPDNAVLVLQAPRPRDVIKRAFDDDVVALVKSFPGYQEAMAKAETQQALGVVRYFENIYNAPLPELLGKLTGGGMTLAVLPGDQTLLIVEAEDAEVLQRVHDFFREIAKGEATKQGHPNQVRSAEYRGVRGWSFAPKESHAIVDNYLLVANQPDTLKVVLDLHAGDGGKSLQGAARFVEAAGALAGEPVLKLYADMQVLKQLPGFQQALKQNENPLARLLFAPLLAGAEQATWLSAGVQLDAEQLTMEVLADQQGASPSALNEFATPVDAAEGAMPNLVVPGQIAALSFYRDLHKFYASKDDLFGERTSGLIFFENMMGIFFSGKDLTEEVLAETLPEMRFVVAEQKYDEKTGTPAMQLPGFAAVLKLRDPDHFNLVVKEAWQKAIGLVNFTRGQKALPGLIIDSATHHGTTYTSAFFSVAEEEDKAAVDVRFNFQPALAIEGDHLIMSSTDALARDLIDALRRETEAACKPVAGQHSLALLQGAPLASILNANRDAMIRQNMVEKGHTREQAEGEIGGLLSVLEYVGQVSVAAGEKEGRNRLEIKATYQLP